MSTQLEAPSTAGTAPVLRPRHLELIAGIQAIFFAQGYRALTMDRLAQELRCSKRALYELAPSRKALFLLIVERWTKRVRALGEQAAARHDDPKERLVAYLQPGITETEGMTEAFLTDLRDFSAAREALEHHQQLRAQGVRAIVEDGVRSGRFKALHAHLVAGVCLAGLSQINQPEFLREAGLAYSEAFSEFYRLLMSGLVEESSTVA